MSYLQDMIDERGLAYEVKDGPGAWINDLYVMEIIEPKYPNPTTYCLAIDDHANLFLCKMDNETVTPLRGISRDHELIDILDRIEQKLTS